MSLANLSKKLKSLSLLSTLFKPQSFSTKTLKPSSHIPSFISNNPFLSTSNISYLEKSLKILFSLNPSPELSGFGISDCSAIRNVLEVSRKFSLGPSDISKRVAFLKGLGFSHGTVIRVSEGCPMVFVMNENGIREKGEFLESFGFDKNQIDMIFGLVPCVLSSSVDNKMRPLFDEFRDLGFARNVVRREVCRDPSVLRLELGELSRCLQLLSSLKCRVPIKEKIFSKGNFRAGIEVKRRVDCLCRYGLIRRDAFKVLWKEPRVILYGVADIEKKIEFLIHKTGLNIFWVVDVPEYLGVNFEKQIVARHNVIEYLRSKGGIGDEVTLKGMIKLSSLRFFNLYVKPYPECEKIFRRFVGDVAVKKQHPAGMWKLFVPKQHPCTEEDVKNIKSFMNGLGEPSVYLNPFVILTKSLLPLPDKYHGLTDVDKRYRQRYVDMIANPVVTDTFHERGKRYGIRWTSGFFEVETPVIQGVGL